MADAWHGTGVPIQLAEARKRSLFQEKLEPYPTPFPILGKGQQSQPHTEKQDWWCVVLHFGVAPFLGLCILRIPPNPLRGLSGSPAVELYYLLR